METRPGTTIFRIRSSCLNKIKKFTNSSLDYFTIFHCVNNSKKFTASLSWAPMSSSVYNKTHLLFEIMSTSTSISTKFFACVEKTLVHWLCYNIIFMGTNCVQRLFTPLYNVSKNTSKTFCSYANWKKIFWTLTFLLYHKQDQIGNLPALYLLNISFNYPLNP